jgi:SAM-dependent methyltransferase
MQTALTDQSYWDGVWQFSGSHATTPVPSARDAMTDRFLCAAFAERLGRGRRFVEIGAGGSPWPAYCARALDAEGWGIDFSPVGLQLAARAAADVSERVTLVEGDVFDRRKLPAHAFDVVYSGGFIEHFPSPRAVLDRFAELVAPDGVVVTLVPNLAGVNGALQALADRDTFSRHVVHTPASLDAAHADAGLVAVKRARYLDVIDLGCVNLSRLATRLGLWWRPLSYALSLTHRAGVAVAARTDADGGRFFAPMVGGVYRRAA